MTDTVGSAVADPTAATVRLVMADLLSLDADADWSSVRYQETVTWDSLVHMALVTELEESFGIARSENDVMDMAAVDSILTVLARHAGARSTGPDRFPSAAAD